MESDREWTNARAELLSAVTSLGSDIDAWRRKKQSEEANARYNEIMRRR